MYLHTMIRVRDQDKAIAFYTKQLNMKVLRQKEFPNGRFTLTFVGYEASPQQAEIELTYNWDQASDYADGDSWGHLAVGVKDIHGMCQRMEAAGADVYRKPGPMKFGGSVIAFVRDPDGHAIELIQRD